MWWRRASLLRAQLVERTSCKPSSLLHRYSDAAHTKGKAAPLQERRMRDRVRIWAKGGDGGTGCWSYRRTRTDRYGKPDGGNGGRGGDVILECSSAIWDFSNLQHHLNAKRGGNGVSKNKIGSRGSDKVVQVPVGTVIHLVSGEAPSFVENISVKSLQPWEIPETDEAGKSRSFQPSNSSVLDKGYGRNSGGSHRKAFETPREKADLKRSHSHFESDSRMLRVEEYGDDEIEIEFEQTPKEKASRKHSLSPYESDSGTMKVEEYGEDEIDIEFEGKSNSSVLDKETTGDSSLAQYKGKAETSERKPKVKRSIKYYESDGRRMKVEEYEIGFDDESGEGDDEEYSEEYEEEEVEEEVECSVAELTKPGQRLVVARGGEGGLGNVAVRKNPKNIKPHRIDQHNDDSTDNELEDDENNSSLTAGIPGSESILILELKSIADVGLVGMPNAGKSTLLGAISRAKPTVGHYAFTTLRPNIGNLNYDDFFSVSVADIPGLIKGAHENRGLGHAFLRHIERTKVLAYVVDLAATLNGGKGIPPWEQLRDLVMELEYHQEGLSKRRSLIVANKIDEEGAEDVYEELKRRVKGVPIFPVCAVLEEGVPELKDGLRRLMDGSESQFLDIDRIMVD
ncbi:uncharacterized protein A4U43_C02F1280 [Asparagus officinalis]|uniref:OBG-type G domain-containing protein n=1 Tax=Asparagus officinalis TaxID=4686 RepID=A0A5P1FFN3_ASPOF|nr:probable GTP-binding protein OBGM, mitochondrial [Asparagus officinalis]XP_020252515.1 probable GTP-binding protein OBGM, mitochondrial [Asparagus officinalis]ONK76922.1 uncharacterized protein A4U43_C02F1280 [Asparagus officinalis]